MREHFYVLQSCDVLWVNPGDDEIPNQKYGGLYFTPEEQLSIQEEIRSRLIEECDVYCDIVSVSSSVCNARVVLKSRKDIRETRIVLKIINEEFRKQAEKYVGKQASDLYFSDCSDWSYSGVMVPRGWIWGY